MIPVDDLWYPEIIPRAEGETSCHFSLVYLEEMMHENLTKNVFTKNTLDEHQPNATNFPHLSSLNSDHNFYVLESKVDIAQRMGIIIRCTISEYVGSTLFHSESFATAQAYFMPHKWI